jgi:hypothetical protein
MKTNEIHSSWKNVTQSFLTFEFLTFLKEEILSKEVCYPQKENIFKPLSLDLREVLVVKVIVSPKDFNESLAAQNVLQLPLQFTEGADRNHLEIWLPFVRKLTFFIAMKQPCVWIFPKGNLGITLLSNIPLKTQCRLLKVVQYHQILACPLSPYLNYIIQSPFNLDWVNVLLERLNKKQINFNI